MQVKSDIRPGLIECEPLFYTCHPLGKLQFIADTVSALTRRDDSRGFEDFDTTGLYAMGEILQECVDELQFLIAKAQANDEKSGGEA